MRNRKSWKVYITGMLTCLSFLFSYAQPNIKSVVNRQEILIGEQFTLKVEANFSPETHRLQWLSIPDSLQHFELVNRSKLDSVYSNNQLSGVTQTFILTSFDSGRWTLPSFRVGFEPVGNDKPYNYFTDSFPITVAFSVSDTSSQLRDIKPIREVEVRNNLWYWIAAGILLVALIIYLIWRSRRGKVQAPVPVVKRSSLSPYDEAMQELKKLEAQDFSDPPTIRIVHTRIGEIIKNYLSRRENDNYFNKTTGDILIFLKQINVDSGLVTSTAGTLRLGDAVKFAKYKPPSQETEQSILSAKTLIESIKQQAQPKPVKPAGE